MSSVAVSITAGVARISLERQDRLNALDLATRLELVEALEQASASVTVRVIVLTGSGRAFCSGQDLSTGDELVDAAATVRDSYNPIVRAITSSDKPVIAAVNGLAVGAGMGIALSCDEIVMAHSAFFSCAFVRVGLVPDSGTTSVLVRRLGHARAFELARTARRVTAEEALELGLVNEVVDDDALGQAVDRRSSELVVAPAHALALTKRLMNHAATDDPDRMLELEARAQGAAAMSPEHAEGVVAFNERRAPQYPNAQMPAEDLFEA